jgi:hypothetical protein
MKYLIILAMLFSVNSHAMVQDFLFVEATIEIPELNNDEYAEVTLDTSIESSGCSSQITEIKMVEEEAGVFVHQPEKLSNEEIKELLENVKGGFGPICLAIVSYTTRARFQVEESGTVKVILPPSMFGYESKVEVKKIEE